MGLFRRRADSIRVDVSARTDVGKAREHNEDRFLVADLTTRDAFLDSKERRYELGPRGSLLVVADGMGGAMAGEVASQMATELIFEQLATRWAAEADGGLDQFAARIREAVVEANTRIHARAREWPELGGMGTTATVVGILGPSIVITQVGDSRAYRVRNGTATQLTRDQSVIQHLVDTGRVTEEEAGRMADKNVILQALGPRPYVEVVQTSEHLADGDTLLLCSDGLSGSVSPTEISDVVTRQRDLARVCRQLVDLANERGGTDNITVVVARCIGRTLPKADEAEDA